MNNKISIYISEIGWMIRTPHLFAIRRHPYLIILNDMNSPSNIKIFQLLQLLSFIRNTLPIQPRVSMNYNW